MTLTKRKRYQFFGNRQDSHVPETTCDIVSAGSRKRRCDRVGRDRIVAQHLLGMASTPGWKCGAVGYAGEARHSSRLPRDQSSSVDHLYATPCGRIVRRDRQYSNRWIAFGDMQSLENALTGLHGLGLGTRALPMWASRGNPTSSFKHSASGQALEDENQHALEP
jgi:hypothetical protein